MDVAKSSSTVFGYFVSLVTVFGTLNWISLLVSYVCMRRGLEKQGIPLSELPYGGPLQPCGAYFALTMTCFIILFNGTLRKSLFLTRSYIQELSSSLTLVLGYTAFVHTFDLTKFIISYICVLVYIANFFGWKIIARSKSVRASKMDLKSDRRWKRCHCSVDVCVTCFQTRTDLRESQFGSRDQIARYQRTSSSLVYIKTERHCRYQISLVIGSILVDRRPAIRNRSANPTLEYTALSFVRR